MVDEIRKLVSQVEEKEEKKRKEKKEEIDLIVNNLFL